jgi:hypothetical protein
MLDLLNSAANDERNKDYTFFLSGDLSQMSTQRSFLSSRGFDLKQNNVYPCLKEEDVEKALKLIWEQRVEGWWHYEDRYVKHGICTKEEFWTRLKAS